MDAGFSFTVTAVDVESRARVGRLVTPHGAIDTPAFLPVGTRASVRSLLWEDLELLGAQIVLANTYHLYLQPGPEVVAELGGLHRFTGWNGPILTDSGGFQVFSLGFGLEHGVGKIAPMFPGEGDSSPKTPRPAKPAAKLTRVDDEGVTFTSHLDGSTHRFTPERSIRIQEQLGADVILAFDECTSPLHDHAYTARALERTHRWAQRSLDTHRSTQALFGIVQGGAYRDLREASAAFVGGLPFDGLAIGGSLGRSKADMHEVLDWTVPLLPDATPRHLLGIGDVDDLLDCVAFGIDTFDCALPTRLARHGALLIRDPAARWRLSIEKASYARDERPIEPACECPTCRRHTRAYLHHLFRAGELSGIRLATVHNLTFILNLMRELRAAIAAGRYDAFRAEFREGGVHAER